MYTMQTFLPYSSFEKSLRCLDRQRLGKQRVESFQILNILTMQTDKKGWINHPAVLMWKGFEKALKLYYNINLRLWEEKGYKNIRLFPMVIIGKVVFPDWLGNEDFHASHRSNLLRKNSDHYGKFGWKESPDLPYIWPITKESLGEKSESETISKSEENKEKGEDSQTMVDK